MAELSASWVRSARIAAEARRAWAQAHGVHARYGAPEGADGDLIDLVGALGEAAVRLTVGDGNTWIVTAPNYKELPGDVGGFQVRATTRPDGRLILHPDDADDATFLLVYVRERDVRKVAEGHDFP